MILWRLTAFPALDGSGGLFASARWHRKGRRIIYTATSPAGALVEVLAGLDLDADEIPNGYRLLKIQASDIAPSEGVTSLPAGWKSDQDVTRDIGDCWLKEGTSTLLRVPSALIDSTENVLIAAERAEAGCLKTIGDEPFAWDTRLLRSIRGK